ncbi:MAG TPA: GIY-YIG nuclease family protein [Dehalococcoidia bacterium]|nr:GIY-YIG nuclease family protein [Dehalococcoidia bacterium]
MSAYVYILRCADGAYYVGSTTNLEARLAEHDMGLGGDFTARRQPTALVFSEPFETLLEARESEMQIKGWAREKKEALIRRDYDALPELSKAGLRRSRRSVLRQAQDEVKGAPRTERDGVRGRSGASNA